MRIEAYNQIASIYKTSKTGKVQQPYGVSTGRDIREDKVAELKTSVQSGKYDVDSGDFASMLLAKYNEMKK